MAAKTDGQVMLLFSVTERGRGAKLIKTLRQQNIHYHLHTVGEGTASSDMMDILGLGSVDKDVIVSFAPYADVARLAEQLSNTFSAGVRFNGLLMILSPSAVSNLFAAVLSRHLEETTKKGASEAMESASKFSLILIAVKQGYSQQVMQVARRAGATGGTVIRARMDEGGQAERFAALDLQPEQEIITILASEATRDQILEDVNRSFGMRTEAGGVLCALPVEKAFKI